MLKANFEGGTISNVKSEENHPLSNEKVSFEVYVAHQQSHVEAAKIYQQTMNS